MKYAIDYAELGVEARGVYNPHRTQNKHEEGAVPQIMFDMFFRVSDQLVQKYTFLNGYFSLRDKHKLFVRQHDEERIRNPRRWLLPAW